MIRIRIVLPLLGLMTLPMAAREIVIPTVAARVTGSNGALWGTEVRVTNLDSVERTLFITDWIGSPCWVPTQYTVSPGATISIGGYVLFRGKPELRPPTAGCQETYSFFGAAVAQADEGLLVHSTLLFAQTPFPAGGTGDFITCPAWDGGYLVNDFEEYCARGAGPLLEHTTTFSPPDATLRIPWLHSDPRRRTNIVLINPDQQLASVHVRLFDATGQVTVDDTVSVPPHSLFQLNDIFANDPYRRVRDANVASGNVAARATLQSNTRLYAVGYVISNINNSTTISEAK